MSDTPETNAAREIAACSQCDRLALRVAHLSEALEAADECLALIEDVGHGAHMDNVTVARGIIAKAMSLDPANAKAMTPGATESPLKRNRNDIEVRSSAPCSPSSLTRETDQLEECDQYKVDEDYAEYNAYRRMVEHARTLERERDEWRKKAVNLHARIQSQTNPTNP